ncbi:MAG: response regulator receiver, partial [Tardiphaga sp.]|nr:response regulator receiver [Tardiphaga sp.]
MARREIVLIVEDEPLLRMLAAESIEADGYEAVEAGHADDAILILESR